MKRTLLLSGAALLVSTLISACNTVEGVGRDIENLGDEIEDEAQEQRRENRRDND
jgi:predicted small secreted protein